MMLIGLSYLEKGANFIESLKNVLYDRSCQFMIAASLLIACGRIVDRFAVDIISPVVYSLFIYILITMILITVLVVTGRARDFAGVFRSSPKVSIAAGSINGLSYLALLITFTFFEVSVAEPASTLNVFIAMFLAARVLKEKINQRWLAAIFIVVGAVFLFL
ncbi:MAG: EamA family transporter [Candidatus Odinarchaeota archaeon]